MKRGTFAMGRAALLASALILASCGGRDEAAPAAEAAATEDEAASAEPEPQSPPPSAEKIAYLGRLAELRGRLNAFIELYHGGEPDAARRQVVGSDSDLYAALAGDFDERGSAGFSGELDAFARAVSGAGDVDEAYSALVNAMAAHEPDATVKERLMAAAGVVRAAADAFAASVSADGAVSDPAAYQRAYGLLIAARDMVSGAQSDDVNASEAVGVAYEQIEAAMASFDGLAVAATQGDASALAMAADAIDAAARRI